MKCPKCEATTNIKWLLRHQSIDENDEGTNANVITILCTECGNNETVFIEDYLPDIFTSWSESKGDSGLGSLGGLGGLFGGLMGGMMGSPQPIPEPTGWRSATNAANEIRKQNELIFGQSPEPTDMEPREDGDIIDMPITTD